MAYQPTPLSVASTNNSTTTTLGISSVFTGTSENVLQYASATVLVFANQASATDGLSIQQSPDGTNWDNLDNYTIPTSTGKSFGVQITGQFLRVVYTNGTTANTVFRLQTLYHYIASPTSSVRPQDARTNDNDMQEVIGYNEVYNVSANQWNRSRDVGTIGIQGVGIYDGTNATTIKAASTAAVTTDKSLVVALNPNSPLGAGTAIIGKVGIDQTTVGTTNGVSIAQIGATTVVNGGVAGSLAIGGNGAAAATATGNPLRGASIGKTANPTAVTDGQTANFISDKLGKQVVVGSIRDLKANQVTTITSSTAETTIVTAGGASVFLDMYGLIVTNTSATAVNVAIKDVTAGTTRLNIAVPAGDTRGFMLPEGGAIKQSTAASAWSATCSASVASVVITALTVANL